MSLLENSTDRHSDKLTTGSSQEGQSDLKSCEGKPNDTRQFLFPDDRFWSIACIVGGLVIASALAVGHHIFLHYLHGRNIDAFPQVWIKGANNGFSNIFSIFVALSATTALTQIKWRASGSEPLRMYTIDNLFELPTPLALLKTLMRPRGSLFFPILSSVLIHALLLVNVLAPSALTVAPSEQISRDINVPIFNLTSQSQFASEIYDVDNFLGSLDLTTMGEQRIHSVLLNLPELTWTIPQDCGLKCAFFFSYDAPGLECHDIIPDASQDPPDLEKLYQGNTNLDPRNLTASSSQQMDVDAPYDLSINYTAIANAFSGNMISSPKAGTYCRFYQATYNASFELNSSRGTQRASTSVISHGDYLTWANTASLPTAHGQLEGMASWAICYTFALAFRGNFSIYNSDEGIAQKQPVLASILNINASTSSFELTVSNLSQTLVDLFSNLTLGLISTRGGQDPVIANAIIWDASSVWFYTTWILWTAYLPAVVLASTVALHGLHTIQLSGMAMDDKFSTFLLATQDTKLYEMCGEATEFEELQRFQLIHQKKGTFLVVNSVLEPSN